MAPTTESRLNVDALSKRDVLLLFSVLEGELEAQDLVIQALRAQHRKSYVWERYGRYDLSDPFLALQRDGEALQDPAQGRRDEASASQRWETNRRSDPLTMLGVVVGHCRRMQEKMLKQLAAAESRHKKLELEKTKVSRVEKENKCLQAQLDDERLQHKQLMTALGLECKRSESRALEEAQRTKELSRCLQRERTASQSLQVELETEKKHAMQLEARGEELLAEFDTERELLSLKLRKEESRCHALQEEVERLRQELQELTGEKQDEKQNRLSQVSVTGEMEKSDSHQVINGYHAPVQEARGDGRQTVENRDNETLSPDQNALTNGSLSTTDLNTDSLSTYSMSSFPQTSVQSSLQAAYQAGIQQRFHAARHKFQSNGEQDSQLGCPLPHASRDQSPCTITIPPAEGSNSKQAARSTVTQALSRFSTKTSSSPNSSLLSTDYHPVTFSGLQSPGVRSPVIPRVERGTPPPIPPKKPGLAETPLSPATLRATHMTQISVGCGCKSTDNTKDPDLSLSSHS